VSLYINFVLPERDVFACLVFLAEGVVDVVDGVYFTIEENVVLEVLSGLRCEGA
jgi:hypothetical protein